MRAGVEICLNKQLRYNSEEVTLTSSQIICEMLKCYNNIMSWLSSLLIMEMWRVISIIIFFNSIYFILWKTKQINTILSKNCIAFVSFPSWSQRHKILLKMKHHDEEKYCHEYIMYIISLILTNTWSYLLHSFYRELSLLWEQIL